MLVLIGINDIIDDNIIIIDKYWDRRSILNIVENWIAIRWLVLLLFDVLASFTTNKLIIGIINTIILISLKRGFFWATCRPIWTT